MSNDVKRPKFRIEKLEERIAPSAVANAMNAAAGDHSPVFYRGDGLHTPGGVVPQDHIGGPGIGDQNPGSADGGAGALRFVFGTSPA